jgi:hypothetical protein
LAVEAVAITMAGLPTLVDGLVDQVVVVVLKEAPLVVVVRALLVKAIPEARAVIARVQAAVVAQGLPAAAAV